ncbi:hypothetical protein B0T13DRAFT_455561 [Neurospora crassa]|nr:hypothetical protein B0T13DRAFT_485228 [Neurospora crassa]KAK3505174.1 hypothetical protein B0T13DRAFT_455561 [Neurospora crassa]
MDCGTCDFRFFLLRIVYLTTFLLGRSSRRYVGNMNDDDADEGSRILGFGFNGGGFGHYIITGRLVSFGYKGGRRAQSDVSVHLAELVLLCCVSWWSPTFNYTLHITMISDGDRR